MPEATYRDDDAGRHVESDGWFVVNLADAAGLASARLGSFIPFEGAEHRFPQFGINVHVLDPGEPNAMYHAESAQEAFLVLHGECTLVVEGEERPLRQWDFFHCPPGTAHVFVGAGEGPCAILMVGTREDDEEVHYPVNEAAARHGASVEAPTDDPREAYAAVRSALEPVRIGWPPGRRSEAGSA